eukprot:4342522-Lingulodinium_polyedra.AAC.1
MSKAVLAQVQPGLPAKSYETFLRRRRGPFVLVGESAAFGGSAGRERREYWRALNVMTQNAILKRRASAVFCSVWPKSGV